MNVTITVLTTIGCAGVWALAIWRTRRSRPWLLVILSLLAGPVGGLVAGSRELRSTDDGTLSIQYVAPRDVEDLARQSLGFCLPCALLAVAWVLIRGGRRAHAPESYVCSECGYDLRFLESSRCPECGQPYTKPLFGKDFGTQVDRSPEDRKSRKSGTGTSGGGWH